MPKLTYTFGQKIAIGFLVTLACIGIGVWVAWLLDMIWGILR